MPAMDQNYIRHFVHSTLLNPIKEVLSPFRQDKASFIVCVSNLIGDHKKKKKTLIPNLSHHTCSK